MALFIFAFLAGKKGIKARFLIISAFIFCAVLGGFSFRKLAVDYQNADLGGHNLNVTADVKTISQNTGYTTLVLKNVNFSGAIKGESDYCMALNVYGAVTVRLGDRLSFSAVIKDRSLIYDGKFSASALQEGVKYYAEVEWENIEIVGNYQNLFERCNEYIYEKLKIGLNSEQFSVAYAMLTGNSDYMTEETLFDYRSAGVAHIFAVSGLHIGFLATAVYFILGKLKANKFFSFIFTFVLCVFYSGVCGFSASSLRAVIMFFFLNIAKIAGLKYDGISSVAIAGFIILVFSPAQLLCAGFLLSFGVVFSIIILYKPLKKAFRFLPDKICSAFAVALAAEIGGAPIMLLFFGQFAALSVLINLLFIPIACVLFIITVLGTLISAAISAKICLFLSDKIIYCINYVISAVDFSIFAIGGFTFGASAIAYYGTIVCIGGLVKIKRPFNVVVAVCLAAVCACGTFAIYIVKSNTTTATVMGSKNLSAAFVHYKDEHALIISDVSYKNFSLYSLKRACNKSEASGVAVVILKQREEYELVALINRLTTAINVEKVYYYGARNEVSENNLKAVFPNISSENMSDGDGFYFGNGQWVFAFGGQCMLFERKDETACVFSYIDSLFDYGELSKPVKTAICLNAHQNVYEKFSPKEIISFRVHNRYEDGERYGNLNISL